MSLKRTALFSLLICTAGTASAATVDLNLRGDAVAGELSVPVTASGLQANFGFLHTENKGNVGSAGILMEAPANPGDQSLKAGVGVKAFFIDGKPTNGSAIGVGGRIRYLVPGLNRILIGADAYYAPDIISFGDTKHFFEYSARVGYRVLPQAVVYLGYRKVVAKFDNYGTITMDDGGHVGIEFKF